MKFAPIEPESQESRLRRWSASGYLTPGLIALICVGLLIATYEHTRGNIHKLKESVNAKEVLSPLSGPGGEDVVRLMRHPATHGTEPEFLSATLLPGRGFNLWQLTAYLPGHGEVPLLVSPPVSDAVNGVLSGTGADANGSGSTDFGGAFLAPWASELSGLPAPATGMLQGLWQGQRISFPAGSPGSLLSTEGLLLNRGSDGIKSSEITDGQHAEALFRAGTFLHAWPSETNITITADLSGHTLDLTLTAENIGTAPEPFGIGWHPYFSIPSGDRENALLLLPSNTRISPFDRRTGQSSGALLPTEGTPFDFVRAVGTRLGSTALNETYTSLHKGILSDGPIAELRDPAFNYGIRITPLSSNVTNFRVIAPAGKPWISIGPNTNMPDPFGHEWDKLENSGVIVLQPGDSVEWKVRLEIFSLTRGGR